MYSILYACAVCDHSFEVRHEAFPETCLISHRVHVAVDEILERFRQGVIRAPIPISGESLQAGNLGVDFSKRSAVDQPLQLPLSVIVEGPELVTLQPIRLEACGKILGFSSDQFNPRVPFGSQVLRISGWEWIIRAASFIRFSNRRTTSAIALRPCTLEAGTSQGISHIRHD